MSPRLANRHIYELLRPLSLTTFLKRNSHQCLSGVVVVVKIPGIAASAAVADRDGSVVDSFALVDADSARPNAGPVSLVAAAAALRVAACIVFPVLSTARSLRAWDMVTEAAEVCLLQDCSEALTKRSVWHFCLGMHC